MGANGLTGVRSRLMLDVGGFRADRVGEDAYAVALAAEARRFTLVNSEIRNSLNRLLQVITWVLVPTAALLVTTQLLLEDAALEKAIRGSVAGVVGMVPEGLVLPVGGIKEKMLAASDPSLSTTERAAARSSAACSRSSPPASCSTWRTCSMCSPVSPWTCSG